MTDRPVINHIAWMGPDIEWHRRDFLPVYDHGHPMVWDEHGVGHKLCALTVIRAGLIKREELI